MLQLKEIKTMRKKLGITQSELAKKAEVSQSLIAKIEKGILDPTYSKAQQILNTLDFLSKRNELTAEKLMRTPVRTLQTTQTIKDAILEFKKYDISQIPILQNNGIIGLVSEQNIMDALLDEKTKDTPLKEIMGDPPPIVNHKTPLSIVHSLLKHSPLVLVTKNGIKGIITRVEIINVF